MSLTWRIDVVLLKRSVSLLPRLEVGVRMMFGGSAVVYYCYFSFLCCNNADWH